MLTKAVSAASFGVILFCAVRSIEDGGLSVLPGWAVVLLGGGWVAWQTCTDRRDG